MSIEVQQRYPGQLFIARCLKRLAPHGWNVNTQFFLVLLGVLGLHLWLGPIVMRSASTVEPGDTQGYFVSDGSGEEQKTSAKSEPDEESEVKSPSGLIGETLVLTDGPLIAKPLSQASSAEPEENQTAPVAAKRELIPGPETLPKPPPAKTPAAGAPEPEKLVAAPVASPIPVEKASAPEVKAADELVGPRLEDLIAEASKNNPPEPTPSASPKPDSSSSTANSPKASSAEGAQRPRIRLFRELP